MIGICCTYNTVDNCFRRLFYVTGRVVKCAVLGRPGMLSKLVEWCESSRSVVRCFSCSRKLSEGQEWNCVIARSPTNHNSGPLRFGRLLVWKDVCRSCICVSVPSIYGTETFMPAVLRTVVGHECPDSRRDACHMCMPHRSPVLCIS